MDYPEQYKRTIDSVCDCASADDSLLPRGKSPGTAGIPPGVVILVAHHGHYWVHLHAHYWPDEWDDAMPQRFTWSCFMSAREPGKYN